MDSTYYSSEFCFLGFFAVISLIIFFSIFKFSISGLIMQVLAFPMAYLFSQNVFY